MYVYFIQVTQLLHQRLHILVYKIYKIYILKD